MRNSGNSKSMPIILEATDYVIISELLLYNLTVVVVCHSEWKYNLLTKLGDSD